MARWLVIHYDGNEEHATIVNDPSGNRLPYGAEDILQPLLQGDDLDFQINAVVEVPDNWDGLVVLRGQEAKYREVTLQ